MVWYSHLFNNFPQFVVIHTIKGFSVLNEPEVDVFLEFSSVILEPKKIKSLTLSIVSASICHEVMGPDAMILVF